MTQSETDPAAKTKHHHGNLRAALVQAGIDLLEQGGMKALSLRKCAALAGVSHAAPAHHFAGLDGLKAAIAQEAFQRFSHFMRQAADQGDQSDRERLKSICRGYLQFGLTHPALLQMIFGTAPADMPRAVSSEDNQGSDAYQILRDSCAPFVPPGSDPQVLEGQVWSLIHGFTLLCLSGQFGPLEDPDRTAAYLDQLLGLLDHLTPPGPVPPPS